MLTKINPESVDLDLTAVLWIADHAVFIDREDLRHVTPYEWFVKNSLNYQYAYRNIYIESKFSGSDYDTSVKTIRVYMHRDLTGCPKNKVVHHINYCGLD
ncbi:unnamed protein product, partial [marine sediment metagenome]